MGSALPWIALTDHIDTQQNPLRFPHHLMSLVGDSVFMTSEWKDVVILLVAGLGLALGGAYLAYSDMAARENAEQVDGVVVESEIVDPNPSRDGTGGGASVEYRYTYAGGTYTSTTICPGEGNGCYSDGKALVENHPQGAEVNVYVNPDSPSQAYLLDRAGLFGTGIQAGYAIMIGFGLVCLVVLASKVRPS